MKFCQVNDSLLLTLSTIHACQFTTMSSAEQLELLPKPNAKSKTSALKIFYRIK